jgi:hypothetical protein
MNFGPKQFDFKTNGVYVIIESLPDIAFTEHSYKVIGVAHSLETAKLYGGPNRQIKGPVPIFDAAPIFPNPMRDPFKPDIFPEPLPNPFKPDMFPEPFPKLPNPNPFGPNPNPFNPDLFPESSPNPFKQPKSNLFPKPQFKLNNNDQFDSFY